MGLFDYLGFGGSGGPTPLVPGATAYGLPMQDQPQPGGGEGFLDRLNNPYVAAALGAGGAMLQARDQGAGFGQAVRSGLGGGAAGLLGAHRQKKADEERRRRDQELDEIRQRFAMIANRQDEEDIIDGPAAVDPTGGLFGGQLSGISGQFGGLF